MRKLAPMFVMTSIVALAGGTAFANTNDTGTPDNKTGSPTVSKNTRNPQALSYADKENAAKGTNARMDTPSSAAGTSTAGGAVAAIDDDKQLTTNDSRNGDSTANKKVTKKTKHKKIAQNGSKTSVNPPVDATHAAAVNSTSGISGGDSGSSSGSSAGSAGSSAGSSGSSK
ncbi:MAG: hypothetical protein ACXWG1_04940 [Usitatibacter sp.]